MVGVGVFTSLGFQLEHTPSGFPVLLLWVVGGVLAFCGAVNYAELAAAFPRSGGEYQLLSRVYHPGVGFVGGWLSMTVGFPAPVAAAALVIGNYAGELTGGQPVIISKLIAAGVVVTITGAHMVSVVFSGRFQWIATALKLLLIAVFTVCGFVLGEPRGLSLAPAAGDGALIGHPDFFASLIFVLYAYCGWNAACYIAGEVENPERNVPRALFIGTAVVTVFYTAVNAAMLYAAPASALAGSGEAVAFVAAGHIFGESGGRIMAGLIAFGLVSTISAMTWAGPRVAQQMGRDYPLLGFLARTDARGVPWMAVLLQGALALLLIFTLDVAMIVTRTTFLLELVLLLTVWGVVHLRVRQPDLSRPCRAWGYPYTTILFLIMVAWTLSQILRTNPDDVRWSMAILLVGVVFYFLVRTPERK